MYHSKSKKLCQMANSDQNTQINNNRDPILSLLMWLHIITQYTINI